jgi:lysozyme
VTTFADLSHHQAGVSVTAYAAAHDRVALKATEGTGYVDPTFTDRWRAAGAAGLARVAYHFDRAAFDGAAQCDWLLGAVARAGGAGPRDLLCLDSEDTATPAQASASAAAFTRRAAAAGYPGCVYTGRWFANPYGITAGVLHPSWRRLWLSDYTASHDDATMPLPVGWDRGQVLARQFTDRATVPGVTGPCDYSRVLIDWINTGDDSMSASEVATLSAQIAALSQQVSDAYRLLTVGDGPAVTEGADTHPQNLKNVRAVLRPLAAAVAAQANDETAILAAITASGSELEARLVAAIEAVPQSPSGGVDAKAVVAELRDALTRGEPPA